MTPPRFSISLLLFIMCLIAIAFGTVHSFGRYGILVFFALCVAIALAGWSPLRLIVPRSHFSTCWVVAVTVGLALLSVGPATWMVPRLHSLDNANPRVVEYYEKIWGSITSCVLDAPEPTRRWAMNYLELGFPSNSKFIDMGSGIMYETYSVTKYPGGAATVVLINLHTPENSRESNPKETQEQPWGVKSGVL